MTEKEKNDQIPEENIQDENTASKNAEAKYKKKENQEGEKSVDVKPEKQAEESQLKGSTQEIKADAGTASETPISKAEIIDDLPDEKDKVIEKPEKDSDGPKGSLESKVDEEHLDFAIPDDEEDEEEEHEEHEIISFDKLSREELVQMLEEVVQEGEVEDIKKKVALIKVTYLKKYKGSSDTETEEVDLLEDRFNKAFDQYRKKHIAYLEELELRKENNLEQKKLILEDLKLLIESEKPLKETYDNFKELQEKWKEIGMVPKKEVQNLWQTYHFYIERFFDKVKISKELKDIDLKKNLESKIELCEKAEELLLERSAITAFKKLQEFHIAWKEAGPVPTDKREEIWERFKTATEKIHQKRRDHYNEIEGQLQKNYESKVVLCEKMEEIMVERKNETFAQWNETTREVNELFKMWRSIGRVPQKHNDEIWDRFKTSMDTFFSTKKEFFSKIKEEQNNNYNLKVELCVQAEAIQESNDWKQTTQQLINLQKEWKKIGPVSRRQSDKIWKRFRAACDTFFNRKSAYFSNRVELEQENLAKKEALVERVKSLEGLEDNKNSILEEIKKIQREWNDIGHVPFTEKDKVYNAFKKEVDLQLDKVNVSKREMATLKFKEKVERLKDGADSGRKISSERNFLMNKKRKLEEDVQLWENNLGFFAQSKQADLLKIEFEKKIQKAKKEIELLDIKIKYLEKNR